jgi:hypothetical protein
MNPMKIRRVLPLKILAVLAVPAVLGFAALYAQEGPWKLVFPPSARTDAGMVYDSGQGRILLFGGAAEGRSCQDTWFFQGGAWTRFLGAPAPSARSRFASCYDAKRGEMLVFGGAAFSGLFNDLWMFKSVWKKAAAKGGPSAREGAAMAFNVHTGDVILFGGRSASGVESDTWKYADGAWTKLNIAKAPPARWKHALVYDSVRRAYVLYGGVAAVSLNDTWTLKGNVWTKLSGPGPGARHAHGLAFDEKGQRTVAFGGARGTKLLGDTWQLKGTAWTRIAGPGPSARAGAAMAYDAAADRVLLYGGWRGAGLLQADTWAFKDNKWVQLDLAAPEARTQHGLAYDASRKKLVLFGGISGAGSYYDRTYYSDTWERDGSGWTKLSVSGPAARRASSMAYDASSKAILLHGGYDAQWTALTDTWTFNGSAWTPAGSDGPVGSGAMAYYPKLGAIVLVDKFYRTYKWQSGAWTQLEASIRPYDEMEEINGTAMVYDARRDVLVLFGGLGNQMSRDWPPLYDTVWEFDGTSWSSHVKPGASVRNWPRKRTLHVLLYDSVRQRVVLSQGETTCRDPNNDNEYYNYRWLVLNDTWMWDGAKWKLVTRTGPARDGSAGVFDAGEGAGMMFGGQGFPGALNIYSSTGPGQCNDLVVLKPPLPAAGKHDFGVTDLSLSKSVWESGNQVKASVTVKNGGASASRPTSVWIYASLDDVIAADDVLISSVALPSIPAGGSLQAKLNITVNKLQAVVPASLYNWEGSLYLYIAAVVDRFEQALDASLVDNILFNPDGYVTLKKPDGADRPGR